MQEIARARREVAEWGSFWGAGFAALSCIGLLCVLIVREANDSPRSLLGGSQMLWGGDGLVTTGDYVDGRRTVPGLHTDCIPGIMEYKIYSLVFFISAELMWNRCSPVGLLSCPGRRCMEQ